GRSGHGRGAGGDTDAGSGVHRDFAAHEPAADAGCARAGDFARREMAGLRPLGGWTRREHLRRIAGRRGGGVRGGRGGGANQGPRQLTSTTSGKRSLQFTAASKEIYYLDGGRISHIAVTGGQARAVDVSAQLDVDFNQEKGEIFAEAWRYLRDNYMN